MKTSIVILIVLLIGSNISAQKRPNSQRPVSSQNQLTGYVTTNEFSSGFGLGQVSVPYSQWFIGISTIHGYKFNDSFIASVGTGISLYNGGGLMPLFADLRYYPNIHIKTEGNLKLYRSVSRTSNNYITPYLNAKVGVLFPVYGEETTTRFFVFPGIGLNYMVNHHISVMFGTGPFIQYGKYRDSFVNILAGIRYTI
jgi:hypothetical protein